MQIMNVGLFAQDFEIIPQQGEDSNIINSVTEYIAEVVLKKYDSFPEDNKAPQQHKHHLNFKNQMFKLIGKDYVTVKPLIYFISTPKCNFEQQLYISFAKEISAPPPKA